MLELVKNLPPMSKALGSTPSTAVATTNKKNNIKEILKKKNIKEIGLESFSVIFIMKLV